MGYPFFVNIFFVFCVVAACFSLNFFIRPQWKRDRHGGFFFCSFFVVFSFFNFHVYERRRLFNSPARTSTCAGSSCFARAPRRTPRWPASPTSARACSRRWAILRSRRRRRRPPPPPRLQPAAAAWDPHVRAVVPVMLSVMSSTPTRGCGGRGSA